MMMIYMNTNKLKNLRSGCSSMHTCNLATLEVDFWNGVGSMPVGGNSPSIGEWIK